MPNIFELDAELNQIAESFDILDDQPELPEAVREQVFAYFGELVETRDTKADNYARFITEKDTRAAALKAEAARITALAKAEENKAKSAKSVLHHFMTVKGMTKWETSFHKFSVCANGGKPPIILDPDITPEDLDDVYQKVTVTVHMEAVREAIESGIEVPFAKLGDRGTHLRIK
jgi:Siphovirus Gp157